MIETETPESIERFKEAAALFMEEHQNTGIAATLLVEHCMKHDPEMLSNFLHSRAVDIVRDFLATTDRRTRAKARIATSRSVFAQAVAHHEEDDDEARAERIKPWLQVRYVIDEDNNRRTLGEMTRDHLMYVARAYDESARKSNLEAMFMLRLAQKVGDGVVSDYYTDEQITRMRQSLRI